MDFIFYILLTSIVVIILFLVIRFFPSSKGQNIPDNTVAIVENESGAENSNDMNQLDLTNAHQQTLVELARKSIETFTKTGNIVDFKSSDPVLNQASGVFVTLRIGEALRGCIGQMWANTPLFETVKDTAISAATRDPRFPPISEAELNQLSIKISILSPLNPVKDISEIEVGKHGLMIVYAGRRGVLLPQVPVDRNWDRITFLENLCLKAGLPPGSWEENAELYSFTTKDFGEG